MNNVLIINSFKKEGRYFLNLFKELSKFYCFFIWTNDDFFPKGFKESVSKKMYFGPTLNQKINFYAFFIFLPFFYVWYFFKLFFEKEKYKIEGIICLNDNEKIIITPLAKILKLKIIWFDEPSVNYKKKSKILLLLLKIFSFLSPIIVFTVFRENELKKRGFKEKNLKNVSLGIEPQEPNYQENIFSKLAMAEKPITFFKNFTIGIISGLNDRGQIEILLRAVKNCINVIVNLQLIIIGSGSEKNNLSWIAKKMEIEKHVWFVGEQECLGKWFDNFDLYAIVNKNPSLFDLEVVLRAMSKKIPILAFSNENLKELVINGETGFFIEPENSEALSKKIIDLDQDRRLIRLLGENGEKLVREYFSRERQAGRVKKHFNL